MSNFMRHLEANHILNPKQHGFRKGLSCETQLVEFSHALLTNIHIGHQTDIIILDFAKAFDKVNHNKLIYKLKAHRVDVLTVEWIEAFEQHISSSRSRWDLLRQRPRHIRSTTGICLRPGPLPSVHQ